MLSAAADHDLARALQWAADIPRTPEGDAQITDLAQRLLNGGRRLSQTEQFLAEAPERLRQPLLSAAFQSLSAAWLSNPKAWVGRLALLTDASRPAGTASLARAWAGQNPEEAVAWANSLATGSSRNGAFEAIASAWGRDDAHQASQWVASLPAGAERDTSAQGLAVAIAEQYPQEAWDWALSISDSYQRSRAASEALKAMAKRDLAAARQWLASGPFSAAVRAQLETELEKQRR